VTRCSRSLDNSDKLEIGWYDLTSVASRLGLFNNIVILASLYISGKRPSASAKYRHSQLSACRHLWNSSSNSCRHCTFIILINWRLLQTPCGRVQLCRLSSVDAHTVTLKPVHGKITRHYSRYCTVVFCCVHKCELSYMCPGHDVILHPYQVKLFWKWCEEFGYWILVKALTYYWEVSHTIRQPVGAFV